MTRAERRIRSRRRTRRGWFVAFALLLVAAALWYFAFRTPAAVVAEATGPTTVAVFPQTYRETVSGTGTLQAARSLEIGFGVAGTVTSVREVGSRVEAGEVLARLDTTPFERSLRDAEFALEEAQNRREGTASGQTDSQMSLEASIRNAEVAVVDMTRALERAGEDLELKRSLHAIGDESDENVQAAQDSYDRAEDDLARAELNLATLRESQALRLVADRQDLRNAELSIEAAQLGLERVREDLAAATLLAPFGGVVAAVAAGEGNSVGSGGAVLTLIDDTEVKLEAQIDETEIGLLSLGLGAEVLLDALPDRTFAGAVTTISPVARLVSNIPIFDVTITLDNADGAMRPGMTAEAEVLVREVEGTVSVPSRALQSVRNRNYLQLLGDDGSFGLHPVQPVATSGLNTIVQGEFTPGAEVKLPAAEVAPAAAATGQQGGGFRLPFIGGGRR